MVEMTGNVAVNKRGDSWLSKRVFFLTPQVKKDLESFTVLLVNTGKKSNT